MRSYFFLPGACVSADAATRFTFAGVLGLRSSFAASLATLLEVCSFVGFFAAAIAARAQIAPHTRQPLQGGIKSTYPTPAARAA